MDIPIKRRLISCWQQAVMAMSLTYASRVMAMSTQTPRSILSSTAIKSSIVGIQGMLTTRHRHSKKKADMRPMKTKSYLAQRAMSKDTPSQIKLDEPCIADHMTFKNNNPMNLYLMNLLGKHRPNEMRTYMNSLSLKFTKYHTVAELRNSLHRGDPLISASTEERTWARPLYSLVNKSAAKHLGIVLGHRLMECGIQRVHWDPLQKRSYKDRDGKAFNLKYHGRVAEFLKGLQSTGVSLWDPAV